ncbi:MAG: dienelactone hydrolase family protein [Marmoricola sp.]
MATVALFHHALGQTPGFHAFAETLRDAGHLVHAPDLFEGRTFESIEAGMAFAEQLGFPDRILTRAQEATADRPADVYAGFSLGVVPAQFLAQTREGARAALLFYSCVPPEALGTAWPPSLRGQIHGMDADPFFVDEGDLDAARAITDGHAGVELYLYRGDQHYFAEAGLPSYDPEAAALLTERTLRFLSEL